MKLDISLSEEEKQLFDEVQVVVSEAAPIYSIWKTWHNYVTFESSTKSGSGKCFQYFQFSKKFPCYACFWIEKIDNYLTVFVDACGAHQNYFELQKFVKKCFPNAKYFTNSDNFHNHPACLYRNTQQRNDGLRRQISELQKEIEFLKKSIK